LIKHSGYHSKRWFGRYLPKKRELWLVWDANVMDSVESHARQAVFPAKYPPDLCMSYVHANK